MYPFKTFSLGEMKGIAKNIHRTVGESILFRLFGKKYAEWVQTLLPSNMTPNFITIVGFLAMQTSYIITTHFDSNLDNYPRLLPLGNAIAMIFYITTDSVDGIHARATNQSSPFGKVLDHFIDSLVVYLPVFAWHHP